MHEWLPLFPLQVVLLPGSQLPLHIFEDRYKEMISDVRRERSEFGVVLASSEGIAGIGCTASIQQVLREYPDGRLDILTVGRRRFDIGGIDEQRSYLRCTAEFFDDDDDIPAPEELRLRALEEFNRARKLASESPLGTAESANPRLSFAMAAGIQDLDLRQALLMARSEADRLKRLVDFFPGYLKRQQRVEHIKLVAPRNGHGGTVNGVH